MASDAAPEVVSSSLVGDNYVTPVKKKVKLDVLHGSEENQGEEEETQETGGPPGHLGRGRRRPLPQCVVTEIRDRIQEGRKR